MSTNSMELETQLIERVVEKRNDILTKAKERAEKILQAAEQEVKMIEAESEKQVLSLVGSELRAVRDRIIGKAELEGRKMVMLTRQELISKVFEEAESRLGAIAEGMDENVDYDEILRKLIVEAASAIGEEEFIVAANERDVLYLKKNLGRINRQMKQILGGGTIKLDIKPINVMGGVVVRNIDGTKTFHNTLEGRLENVKIRVEAEIGKKLGVI
jgi:vacuolar-type H+-ATPase subunit E/Vma4